MKSIPIEKINKMNKDELLIELQKAEHDLYFTCETWTALLNKYYKMIEKKIQ